jgi:hypothetical protein
MLPSVNKSPMSVSMAKTTFGIRNAGLLPLSRLNTPIRHKISSSS